MLVNVDAYFKIVYGLQMQISNIAISGPTVELYTATVKQTKNKLSKIIIIAWINSMNDLHNAAISWARQLATHIEEVC